MRLWRYAEPDCELCNASLVPLVYIEERRSNSLVYEEDLSKAAGIAMTVAYHSSRFATRL